MRPSVTVLFLGGTIGMTAQGDGGATPRLGADDLLAGLPGTDRLDLRGIDLFRVGSSHLTFDHVLAVAREAEKAVAGGADGVVVVQGTDSLEETAYLLDLLWPHDRPLVLTGAMRNPGLPGPDGPANLVAALAVAGDPACAGLGAVVVLNDEVHAARSVAKRHTSLPSAFESPHRGPVARMLEGTPVVLGRVPRRGVLPRPERLTARVRLHLSALDDDPAVLCALADGADGLVVAGFGAGHLKTDVAEAAGDLAGRMPVVLASRTGSGAVHARTYGGPGSERDLLGRGLVSAGHLDPLKARLLLTVLLSNAATPEQVRAAFVEHGAG